MKELREAVERTTEAFWTAPGISNGQLGIIVKKQTVLDLLDALSLARSEARKRDDVIDAARHVCKMPSNSVWPGVRALTNALASLDKRQDDDR